MFECDPPKSLGAEIARSNPQKFEITNPDPGELISPAHGATLDDTTPDFEWLLPGPVPSYAQVISEFTLKNLSTGQEIWSTMIDHGLGPDPTPFSYNPFTQDGVDPLVPGQEYRWTVRMVDGTGRVIGAGAPQAGESRTFDITPIELEIIEPEDGDVFDTLTPMFEWESDPRVNYHKLVFSINPTWDVTVIDTGYTYDIANRPLECEETYTVRVDGYDVLDRKIGESDEIEFSISVASCDTDGDEVRDELDNCPAIANPRQEDSDFDGIGDACDDTPQGDGDGDGGLPGDGDGNGGPPGDGGRDGGPPGDGGGEVVEAGTIFAGHVCWLVRLGDVPSIVYQDEVILAWDDPMLFFDSFVQLTQGEAYVVGSNSIISMDQLEDDDIMQLDALLQQLYGMSLAQILALPVENIEDTMICGP
ncbi:MAG: hypothetical protein ACE5JP_17035 [Candidatus Bipolaricaulia bacterium]